MEYYGITFADGSKIAHAKEGWEKPGHKWIKRTKGKNGKWQYIYKDKPNFTDSKLPIFDQDKANYDKGSYPNPSMGYVVYRGKNGVSVYVTANENDNDATYMLSVYGKSQKSLNRGEARELIGYDTAEEMYNKAKYWRDERKNYTKTDNGWAHN